MSKNLPFMTTLKPGTYFWCACGKSAKEPFCDGVHRGSGEEPLVFEIAESLKAANMHLQVDKRTPYCDGAHARID